MSGELQDFRGLEHGIKTQTWHFVVEDHLYKESAMRLLLFLLAICAGIVWIGAHAEAQNYPWCAQFQAVVSAFDQ